MSIYRFVLCVFISVFTSMANADNGLVSIKSNFTVSATGSRFEQLLSKKGLTLFNRINHSSNAASVDLKLRPTEVIIFGNPKVGTPLMQCSQTMAIDLPQKVLIFEDENGQVWLTYNDPVYLKRRHKIEACEAVITKVSKVLNILSASAASH